MNIKVDDYHYYQLMELLFWLLSSYKVYSVYLRLFGNLIIRMKWKTVQAAIITA